MCRPTVQYAVLILRARVRPFVCHGRCVFFAEVESEMDGRLAGVHFCVFA